MAIELQIQEENRLTLEVESEGSTLLSSNETYKSIVNDYNELTNKPQINDVTLEGNLTLEDLGYVVDNELSTTSANPVENRVVTQTFSKDAYFILSKSNSTFALTLNEVPNSTTAINFSSASKNPVKLQLTGSNDGEALITLRYQTGVGTILTVMFADAINFDNKTIAGVSFTYSYVRPGAFIATFYGYVYPWDASRLNTIEQDIDELSQHVEYTSNKVTSISSASTDTQYPSAKAVYDAIDASLPESISTDANDELLYFSVTDGDDAYYLDKDADNYDKIGQPIYNNTCKTTYYRGGYAVGPTRMYIAGGTLAIPSNMINAYGGLIIKTPIALNSSGLPTSALFTSGFEMMLCVHGCIFEDDGKSRDYDAILNLSYDFASTSFKLSVRNEGKVVVNARLINGTPDNTPSLGIAFGDVNETEYNACVFLKNATCATAQIDILGVNSTNFNAASDNDLVKLLMTNKNWSFTAYTNWNSYAQWTSRYGSIINIAASTVAIDYLDVTKLDVEGNAVINGSTSVNGNINTTGSVTAASIVKSGGTSGQFLKADGSVDSTVYSTFSGNYNDLTNKPTIPTKTSDLTNDGSDGTSTYIEADDLATVATSGSYDDLINKPTIPAAQVNSDWNASSGVAQILNKPTIPTKTSDLTNDSGFITGITSSDVTSALGYTPYNSTNPNGYVNVAQAANAAPVQSVNGQIGAVVLTIPTVPTNVSAFTNDAGYLTLADLPIYNGGVQ